jgi:hypothetical protein
MVRLLAGVFDDGPGPVRATSGSASGGGRLRLDRRQERSHATQELGGHVVAPALRAHQLLQAALELGTAVAGGALPQVTLDLHALDAHELSVEEQLDLAEHVLAISL